MLPLRKPRIPGQDKGFTWQAIGGSRVLPAAMHRRRPLMVSSMRYSAARYASKIMAVIGIAALLLVGCTQTVSRQSSQQEGKMANSPKIDEASARAIAKEDAIRVYRDLSI